MISELTAWPVVEGSRRRQVEYNESDCHKATYNGHSSTCVIMRYIEPCWQRHWQKLIRRNWVQQGKREVQVQRTTVYIRTVITNSSLW